MPVCRDHPGLELVVIEVRFWRFHWEGWGSAGLDSGVFSDSEFRFLPPGVGQIAGVGREILDFFEGGLARGPLRCSNPSVPQPRMDARLEERDESSNGLLERFSWERNKGTEERLQALEGFGNSLVVG